jgi:hypothetical protein
MDDKKDNENQIKENKDIINEENKNEIKEDENNNIKNNELRPLELKTNKKERGEKEEEEEEEEEVELEDAIVTPDFSKLDAQDPSLIEGYKIIYEKELPMDLKIENKKGKKNICSYEGIIFKILTIQSSSESIPSHIRIELYSENDIFFHFTSLVDEEIFKVMKEKQFLTIEYKDFIVLVEELCDNCLNNPEIFTINFIMKKNGEARLEITKKLDVKYIDLLKIEFVNSSDDYIIKQMNYRYGSLLSKLDYYKNCIKVAGDIILENNRNIVPKMLEYKNYYNQTTSTTEYEKENNEK